MDNDHGMVDNELDSNFDLKKIEDNIRSRWKSIGIEKLIEGEVDKNPPIGYVEGPPTLNGEPHLGHLRGRIMKDLWYRFSTLGKLNIVFRAGWDTQGLPVELQAEKELGLTGSKAENLKKVGEETLVKACKELVSRYHEKWYVADELLGMSLDQKRAYWTYKDEYIEREWMYLEQAWAKDILRQGEAVVPYCPNCQTSLSHAEVAQGYENVEDPSLYFKAKMTDQDAYLIVWTTMPFTIVTDMMIGVKPDAEYCFVKVGSETWVVSSSRLEDMMKMLDIESYNVIKRVSGSSLEGKKYVHPIAKKYIPALSQLSDSEQVHTVVAEDFVDITTGTGLVHLAPANGEIDYGIGKKRGLPLFNPIDGQVKFTHDAGRFEGLFVRDADQLVSELMEEEGMLVKLGKIKHEYPLCWRSGHRLVWVSRREYFYQVEKLDNLAIKAAESVEYYYEHPKNRFLEIVKEKVPWCISRERVWGTPLPIWVCQDCDEKFGVFSRKKIIDSAISLPDGENFELHKPWIDRILLKCPKCGGESKREPFVLDTWHNSGAAPLSSFSNEENEKLVPVLFLTEGIDQTRGWAYTLLINNVILSGKAEAPYRAFLFQGHVLDKKGNKMSKKLGNIIKGTSVLSESSVDVLRFYLMKKSSPVESLNFSDAEMKSRPYQVISTLYHLHKYFQQNSEYDNFDSNKHTIQWAADKQLLQAQERWLLSKIQRLITNVSEGYQMARYHESAASIESFIIDVLSQSYLPMTRGEIWADEVETHERRLAIYAVISYSLRVLDIILHPISPFITDYLYLNLFKRKESILLDDFPISNERLFNDDLEDDFSVIEDIISTANAARMKGHLKRRWPLGTAILLTNKDAIKRSSKHMDLLKEMLNVKELRLTDKIDESPIYVNVKPRYDLLGQRLKEKVTAVRKELDILDDLEAFKSVKNTGSLTIHLKNETINISEREIDFLYSAKDGYVVSERSGIVVALETKRDPELIAEGLVRDVARRLQSLRKDLGLNPTEILERAYVACLDTSLIELITPKIEELSFLVRVKDVEITPDPVSDVKWSDSEIDGKTIKIAIH